MTFAGPPRGARPGVLLAALAGIAALLAAVITPAPAAASEWGARIAGDVFVPAGYLHSGPAGEVTITDVDRGYRSIWSFWSYDDSTTKLSFEFPYLRTGRYKLVYNAGQGGVYQGDIAWTSNGGFPGEVGEVIVAGVGTTRADFHVPAGVSVSGTVTFPLGFDGTGATVVASTDDGTVWNDATISTDDGTFAVDGLWPGLDYQVAVYSEGGGETSIPLTYYTGSPSGSVNEAERLLVSPPVTGIAFVPELAARVSGTLVLPAGAMAGLSGWGRGWISATRSDGVAFEHFFELPRNADGSGVYDLADVSMLPAGTYHDWRFRVDARYDTSSLWRAALSGPIAVSSTASSDLGTVALVRTAQIRGTVTLSGRAAPLAGDEAVMGEVDLYRKVGADWELVPAPVGWQIPDLADVDATTQLGDVSIYPRCGLAECGTDGATGAFLYAWLEPGTYRLGVRAWDAVAQPDGTFVATGTHDYCETFLGGAATLEDSATFTLAAGQSKTDIDLTLPYACGVVPVVSSRPTVSGVAAFDQTLTASPGEWGPGGVDISYRWFANAEPIEGATGPTLTITPSLAERYIQVEVTGLRDGYGTVRRMSASSPVVIDPALGQFIDVASDRAFMAEISWLAQVSVTTGWDAGGGWRAFRPDQPVLRDQMAAFLYRFAGSPEFVAPAVSPFRDVPTSYPFYKEITWLASTGVTTGWSVGGGVREFRPFEPVLRDQMAAFLYRFAGSPEFVAPAVSPFRDVPTSYPFYKEITWLAGEKISTGWAVSGGAEFRQFQPVLRDQMAAFLYRSSWW